MNDWFNADGPGYEHLNEQGIVEVPTVSDNVQARE